MPHGSQCMPGCDLPTTLDGGFLVNPGDFIVAFQPLDGISCPMAGSAWLAVTYPVRQMWGA